MSKQTQELNALVVQYIYDVLFDGLEKCSPLWNYISKEGKKRQKGGTYIQFPIKLLKNESQGFISGVGATVSATPSIQLQYGVLPCACLSRCPRGERPLVELYLEPGVFSERCTEKLPLRAPSARHRQSDRRR